MPLTRSASALKEVTPKIGFSTESAPQRASRKELAGKIGSENPPQLPQQKGLEIKIGSDEKVITSPFIKGKDGALKVGVGSDGDGLRRAPPFRAETQFDPNTAAGVQCFGAYSKFSQGPGTYSTGTLGTGMVPVDPSEHRHAGKDVASGLGPGMVPIAAADRGESFSPVYGMQHAEKDTASGLGPGMVPAAKASQQEAFHRGGGQMLHAGKDAASHFGSGMVPQSSASPYGDYCTGHAPPAAHANGGAESAAAIGPGMGYQMPPRRPSFPENLAAARRPSDPAQVYNAGKETGAGAIPLGAGMVPIEGASREDAILREGGNMLHVGKDATSGIPVGAGLVPGADASQHDRLQVLHAGKDMLSGIPLGAGLVPSEGASQQDAFHRGGGQMLHAGKDTRSGIPLGAGLVPSEDASQQDPFHRGGGQMFHAGKDSASGIGPGMVPMAAADRGEAFGDYYQGQHAGKDVATGLGPGMVPSERASPSPHKPSAALGPGLVPRISPPKSKPAAANLPDVPPSPTKGPRAKLAAALKHELETNVEQVHGLLTRRAEVVDKLAALGIHVSWPEQ